MPLFQHIERLRWVPRALLATIQAGSAFREHNAAAWRGKSTSSSSPRAICVHE
jgi:hypothetical protein